MKFQIISCNIILNLSQFLIGEITNLFVYAIPYPLPASDHENAECEMEHKEKEEIAYLWMATGEASARLWLPTSVISILTYLVSTALVSSKNSVFPFVK